MTVASLLPTVHASLLAARRQVDNAIAAMAIDVDERRQLALDFEEALGALRRVIRVIDSAGLINLSHGVQLGPTVWYVKAFDAVESARAAISKAEGRS